MADQVYRIPAAENGHDRGIRPGTWLLILSIAVAACCALFMTLGANGNWDFILPLRMRKLATLILVAYAIGVSTVLFQTATGNRILTPAVMGFDALYILIQTCLVFLVGAQASLALDERMLFIVQIGIMVAASALLYRTLFHAGHRSLHQLVLAGIVLGVLFRSLSSFIQRIINPNEFAYLQDRLFASFNNPDETLLLMSAATIFIASVWALRWVRACDVLSLGREPAINLGIEYHRLVMRILVVVAILTSVSTALVGPITFFGLLVSHLTYTLLPTFRHALLLPATILIGVLCLVGGQLVLERLFAFDTNLRVIIDFVGGLIFILLLMRRTSR
ncbi:iron chelate uptake ABC transporter family permease subunit [Pseudomonas cichorii]|uniref:iron chelate uptake ABC transporter family permease subunit n=1 Tax=Pseudomonas cichorii TaxID=36746 RepID=UPI0018E64B76|nr:iron chelate uptake ABC transporter family permease subunit [Pseudomonas cichorii]MBI6854249.1 iron chelate uptake ABC transporter family permease subunit [Pseudomonas cichorii]